jgi:hypothetical protein
MDVDNGASHDGELNQAVETEKECDIYLLPPRQGPKGQALPSKGIQLTHALGREVQMEYSKLAMGPRTRTRAYAGNERRKGGRKEGI